MYFKGSKCTGTVCDFYFKCESQHTKTGNTWQTFFCAREVASGGTQRPQDGLHKRQAASWNSSYVSRHIQAHPACEEPRLCGLDTNEHITLSAGGSRYASPSRASGSTSRGVKINRMLFLESKTIRSRRLQEKRWTPVLLFLRLPPAAGSRDSLLTLQAAAFLANRWLRPEASSSAVFAFQP